MTRREFLKTSMWGLAIAAVGHSLRAAAEPPRTLRIALLHLAPKPADLEFNRGLITRALIVASECQAEWVLTPELTTTGYTFADQIGTDWIEPQPDPWMKEICGLISQLHLTVFLSVPERDPVTRKLHNSVCVIAPNGTVTGIHRKINTLRVGSESWSTPGDRLVPLPAVPFDRVGILICADAFSTTICQSLKAQGAQILVSAAAWAPGLHGPNGEWERCTVHTGLPLLVCNRTGLDRTLDFRGAHSVVVKDGRRLLSMSSERSTVFLIEWDLQAGNLANHAYRTVYLD